MKKTLFMPFLWVCLFLSFYLPAQAQVTLPFLEDFEGGGPDTTFTTNTPILNGLSGAGYVWSYEKTAEGRLRMRAWQDWGLVTPFTTSGNHAITLDDTLGNTTSINDLILTINMSAYTGNQAIEMGFNFANHGEEPHPNDRIFVRGSILDPWLVLYDLIINQPTPGNWKNVKGVDVDSVLTLFSQSFSTSTQFRFGQEDDFGADGPAFSDGYSFDDVQLYQLPDISAAGIALASPASACGLGMDTVCITYGNIGTMAFDSSMMYYSINGSTPVSALDTTNLNPGDQTTYCFTTLGNFSALSAYTVKVWVQAPGDTLPADDTVTTVITHFQAINTFPYFEDFDTGPGGWTSGGTNASWGLATPSGPVIQGAASGPNAWVTNPTGSYNSNENSFVQSPCLDFTGMLMPRICFSVWWNSEFSWDGTALQSSIDDGLTWQLVGTLNGLLGDPVNWYNDNAIDANPGGQMLGWTGRTTTGDGSNGYVVSQQDLIGLGGQSQVLLRVAFAADGLLEDDGFAFDDVLVFDKSLSDASALAILSPVSGCGLGMETVSFAYYNTGAAAFDSASLSFQINGGPITSEIDTSTLQAGDSTTYTFTGLADLSTPGLNTITVWAKAPNDVLPFKDTLSISVYHIQVVSAFPYVESFESGPADWTAEGNGSWQLGLPQGVVIDTAATGVKAWMTDTVGNYVNGECSFVVSPCFDFSALLTPVIRANVWVNSESMWDGATIQATIDSGQSWLTLGAVGDPNNWFNLANIDGLTTCINNGDGWTGTTMTNYVPAEHRVTLLAGEPSVRFRFAFAADGFFNGLDGFAFDDFEIFEQTPPLDASIIAIEDPISNCSIGIDTICISYFNNSLVPFDSASVSYQINGGTVTTERDTLTLQPGDTAYYCFTTLGNFTAVGNYIIDSWVSVMGDTLNNNDSTTKSINNITSIATFPYDQDFENGPGDWSSGGTNNTWQHGRPVGTTINSAASGLYAWVTDTVGTYNDNENSFVISPCFDFSSLILPILDVAIWWEAERSFDGAVLQSTIDEGHTWVNVGKVGAPNWYNDTTINGNPGGQQKGWTNFPGSIGNGMWVQGSQVIRSLAGQPQVRFRFAFGSDGSVNNFDGFAFDDFSIRESPALDIQALNPLSPQSNCGLGTEQISFRYTNGGITGFDSARVSYTINGSTPIAEIDIRTVNPGDTIIYPFTALYNFTTPGTYQIMIICDMPGDSVNTNDTLRFTVNSIPSVSSFPHLEDFEGGSGGWTAEGNGNWQWGLPQGATINTAASGVKAWATDTANTYMNSECSYAISPCFDLSTLTFPAVAANIWVNSENTWDGTVLQATTDSGLTWITIGVPGSGNNWYNNTSVTGLVICLGNGVGWTGVTSRGYVYAEHEIAFLAGEPDVRFRFLFGSDRAFNLNDGFAFDDFEVKDLPPNDVGVVQVISPIAGACGDSSTLVTVIVKNNGSSDQLTFPILVNADTGNTTYATLNYTYNDTLRPGKSDTVIMGTINTHAGGIFTFTSYTQLGNDADRSNDTTILGGILILPIPDAPTISDTTICRSGPVTLSVLIDTNFSYIWYDSTVGGNLLADSTHLTAMVTRDTTFYVEAQQKPEGPCLRITEAGLGFPDLIEIQNLSPQTVDATGYVVAVSDSYSDINDVNTTLWTLGSMTAGQILFRDDNFNSAQFWGRDLFFSPGVFPGFAGWAMIIDTNGIVIDAVFWGWEETDITSFNTTINGFNITGASIPWQGDGVNVAGLSGDHIELFGPSEENNLSDWDNTQTVNSPGSQNSNLPLTYICGGGGCPSARIAVNVIIQPLQVDLGSDRAVCVGTTLDGTTVGGVFYLWNTTATTSSINVTQSGQYVLQVSNPDGCVSTDTINLIVQPLPTVELGPVDTVGCGAVLLNAGNPGSQYAWSTGGQAQTELITTPGTYSVNVTTLSGCSVADTITVSILPLPTVTLGPDVTACEDAILDPGIFPTGFTYLWSTNDMSQTITVTTTGLYTVTVTDTAGCEGTDAIFVNIFPGARVDLGMDRTECDSVILDAGSFNTFTWNTMETRQTIIANTSGTYYVEVLDNNGCIGTDTVELVIDISPEASWTSVWTSATDVTFTNGSTPSGAGVTYLWDFGDGNSSTLESPTHSYALAGNYQVSLTVMTANCGDDESLVTIGTDLEDDLFDRSITLFPNPSNGIFALGISGLQVDELHITVSDVTGKTIVAFHKNQRINGNFEHVIDLTGHAKGVYMVTVFDGQRFARKKMVVR